MRPKSYSEFTESLNLKAPLSDWSLPLQAVWWDANGNWEASHNIAQDLHTQIGSWIHAYLHRKEGDDWNAGYWYSQANRSFPQISLDEELKELVGFIIS